MVQPWPLKLFVVVHLYLIGFDIPLLDGVYFCFFSTCSFSRIARSSRLTLSTSWLLVLDSAMVPLLKSGLGSIIWASCACHWDVTVTWPSQLIEQGSIDGWICATMCMCIKVNTSSY